MNLTEAEDVDATPPEPIGELIEPCETLLFRQVHPMLMRGTEPGKSNFIPEDGLNLSTRHESMGAKTAYEEHIQAHKSLGTWGVKVIEAHTAGLPSYDDANLEGNPPFHVSIRFPHDLTDRGRERFAKKLHGHAKLHGAQGWLYRPDMVTSN